MSDQLAQLTNIDLVQVPESLPPGDYVLSFRHDSEETPQVWTNCADVTIVGPDTAAPTATPTQEPAKGQVDDKGTGEGKKKGGSSEQRTGNGNEDGEEEDGGTKSP